jgi:hypothetical protein
VAALTTQSLTRTGKILPDVLVAAGGSGDTFQPGDRTFLIVKNGSGGSITVTVTSERNCSEGVEHDTAATVPNGKTYFIGPFPPQRFADPVTNVTSVAYSATTSVTVGVINVSQL